ncbi:MAG TPA: UvrD-helicase domain-containing protein [Bryobacteraceae bacterium]|nr:UvrD-helicase domain-containing protein [Bryobacteraceae bacterium]
MDFLEGLNPRQREAASHVDGPLLILAGAGSGKTRVITHRLAHLIHEHGVPPYATLAVTFTNKAADEMRQRIESLLARAGASGSPVVATFHSFCVRLLRRDGDRLAAIRPNFTRKFNIYDDDDQLSIVKSTYRQLGLDEKFMQYRAALSRISHAKNHGQTPQDFYKDTTDPKMSRLAVIFERYENRLRESNALDFDDLLLETVRLLRHDAEVRSAYNTRYRYLMIDEYQDTNRSQYELVRLLTQEHSNVVVVGDEDQSIYGWRGADIRNILDFERDYPKARVIRLEQNYRSTKTILEAASAVVANNKARKGKWLWTDSGQGEPVGFYEAPDSENEALWIADTIEKTLGREPKLRVAVLYRTNFQSRQIEEALRRYGRKYIVVGGLSFYGRAEIKDLLAYMKVAQSPNDSISLLRIINTPARGIGKTTVEQIEQFALENNLSVWNALIRTAEERTFGTRAESAIAAFRRLVEDLNTEAATRPLDQLLRLVLDRTGYQRMLEADPSPETESRIGNLQELLNAAADAAERGESLADFLDHAALVSDADQVDTAAQVSLLTIHNAKGLEFPIVFLAGMEEGLFPHMRSLDSEAQMEEERRLCYVGMTRAEKRLYLSWARFRRRWGGGQPEPSIASRFLAEVPKDFIEQLGRTRQVSQPDLYAETQYVRETARRNMYNGKAYNSVENISQFFAERGMPVPSGLQQRTPPAAQTPAAAPPQPRAQAPQPPTPNMQPRPPQSPSSGMQARPPQTPASAPPRPSPAGAPGGAKKKFGPGSTVTHPKFGRGTVMRREGDGDDARLTISFPGYGLKKIIEKYAGIKNE